MSLKRVLARLRCARALCLGSPAGLLNKAGWEVSVSIGTGQLSGGAKLDSRLARNNLQKHAQVIYECMNALNLA